MPMPVDHIFPDFSVRGLEDKTTTRSVPSVALNQNHLDGFKGNSYSSVPLQTKSNKKVSGEGFYIYSYINKKI